MGLVTGAFRGGRVRSALTGRCERRPGRGGQVGCGRAIVANIRQLIHFDNWVDAPRLNTLDHAGDQGELAQQACSRKGGKEAHGEDVDVGNNGILGTTTSLDRRDNYVIKYFIG